MVTLCPLRVVRAQLRVDAAADAGPATICFERARQGSTVSYCQARGGLIESLLRNHCAGTRCAIRLYRRIFKMALVRQDKRFGV